MSESEEEAQNNSSNKRKKGVIKSELYKRNSIKRAKVKGEEHVNWAGKKIQEKKPGSTVCG